MPRRAAGAERTQVRIAKLASIVCSGVAVTNSLIRARFGVSKATASRDLTILEIALPLAVELVPQGSLPPRRILRLPK